MSQTYERRFIEFQTGIPFTLWRRLVKRVDEVVALSLPDA
jgi:hypothetical protein